jgi:Flp pilus assembly pilin Flp
MVRFMARFVADEKGNYLDETAARLAVRKVTIGQMKSAFEKITTDVTQAAAPNE